MRGLIFLDTYNLPSSFFQCSIFQSNMGIQNILLYNCAISKTTERSCDPCHAVSVLGLRPLIGLPPHLMHLFGLKMLSSIPRPQRPSTGHVLAWLQCKLSPSLSFFLIPPPSTATSTPDLRMLSSPIKSWISEGGVSPPMLSWCTWGLMHPGAWHMPRVWAVALLGLEPRTFCM